MGVGPKRIQKMDQLHLLLLEVTVVLVFSSILGTKFIPKLPIQKMQVLYSKPMPRIQKLMPAKPNLAIRGLMTRKKKTTVPQSKVKFKSLTAKYIEQEDDEEENEGKYKMIRHHVEKFFKQTKFGKWIEIFMGIISFMSSVAFVVLTYWDLSEFDSCC